MPRFSVDITDVGTGSEILLDGKRLECVEAMDITVRAERPTQVMITFTGVDVTVTGDDLRALSEIRAGKR